MHSLFAMSNQTTRRFRQETTMTLKWIAHRLKMRTRTNVTKRLYHSEK
jgi:hypothetical protein